MGYIKNLVLLILTKTTEKPPAPGFFQLYGHLKNIAKLYFEAKTKTQ